MCWDTLDLIIHEKATECRINMPYWRVNLSPAGTPLGGSGRGLLAYQVHIYQEQYQGSVKFYHSRLQDRPTPSPRHGDMKPSVRCRAVRRRVPPFISNSD